MSNCNCFDEIKGKADKAIREQLPDGATEIDVSWKPGVFIVSSSERAPVPLQLEVSYRKVKLNGDPAKNVTRETVNIHMKHCPFCGRKYGD